MAKKRNSQANRRSSVGFIVHSKRRSLHHGRSAPVDSRSCSGRHLRTWSSSHARGQARMTCYARSGKHSTIHTLESTLHTLHTVTLYIPYSRLCPPLPLTSNSTPHSTLNSTHCTQHFILYTLHSTLLSPHFIVYTPRSSLYIFVTLHTLHSSLRTLHRRFTLHTAHAHSTPYTTLYTLHSTNYTPLSTPCT